jgi:hypothetical protein
MLKSCGGKLLGLVPLKDELFLGNVTFVISKVHERILLLISSCPVFYGILMFGYSPTPYQSGNKYWFTPTKLFLSPSALHCGCACYSETVKQVEVPLGKRCTLLVARCSATHSFIDEFCHKIPFLFESTSLVEYDAVHFGM